MALWIGAGIVLVALILLLVVHFTSPSPGITSTAVPEKQIPTDWVAENQPPETTTGSAPWSSTGSLVLSADGRPFGDETYQLDVSADGASLSSTGRFWFKVVLATLHIAFRQQWEGTADLRPASYSLHLDAPLGQGQEIAGHLDGDRYVVRRNSVETIIPVVPERTVVLGMFSTYAMLPLLFAEREVDGVATFDALIFGGPPGPAKGDVGGLPAVVVERAGTVNALIDGIPIAVDRFQIRSPYGDSTLYAKGREFLALTAGTADRPLVVYRSDYFPDGFSLVNTGG
jgi:hypothetical protein